MGCTRLTSILKWPFAREFLTRGFLTRAKNPGWQCNVRAASAADDDELDADWASSILKWLVSRGVDFGKINWLAVLRLLGANVH